jgi:hypothetical protein
LPDATAEKITVVTIKIKEKLIYFYRLDWAKKVSLAAICLVAGSASFGLREN